MADKAETFFVTFPVLTIVDKELHCEKGKPISVTTAQRAPSKVIENIARYQPERQVMKRTIIRVSGRPNWGKSRTVRKAFVQLKLDG